MSTSIGTLKGPTNLSIRTFTASLDPNTETSILETLHGLTNELTILAISHRPKISVIADHGLCISDGKVSPAFKTEIENWPLRAGH